MSTGEEPSSEHPLPTPDGGQSLIPAVSKLSEQPIARRPLENDAFYDSSFAHLPELMKSDIEGNESLVPQRQVLLPAMLFVATCLSTFWVGATRWDPMQFGFNVSWCTSWRRRAAELADRLGVYGRRAGDSADARDGALSANGAVRHPGELSRSAFQCRSILSARWAR